MTELQLSVNQSPGEITFNYDEIAAALEERLEEYKGAVFTEDSKKEAKNELANLRKLRDDFEKIRKAVKKQWNEPYTEFERKIKQLTAKIDEPIALIDSQVKEFEAARKEERRKLIEDIYLEKASPNIRQYAPLDKIYRTQWENATTNEKRIREEMSQALQAVKTAVAVIQGMNSDAVPDALGIFRESQDLERAVLYVQDYEARKAQILKAEEEKRKAEEARLEAAKQEIKAAEAAIQQAAEIEKELAKRESVETVGDDELPFETPSTRTVFYRVVATEDEIRELDRILDSIGIWWKRSAE